MKLSPAPMVSTTVQGTMPPVKPAPVKGQAAPLSPGGHYELRSLGVDGAEDVLQLPVSGGVVGEKGVVHPGQGLFRRRILRPVGTVEGHRHPRVFNRGRSPSTRPHKPDTTKSWPQRKSTSSSVRRKFSITPSS